MGEALSDESTAAPLKLTRRNDPETSGGGGGGLTLKDLSPEFGWQGTGRTLVSNLHTR